MKRGAFKDIHQIQVESFADQPMESSNVVAFDRREDPVRQLCWRY
jgi:hypothetical protein